MVWDTSPSGLIEAIIDALTCLQTSIQILVVPFDELVVGVIQEEIHIVLLARAQIIQATDFVSHPEDRLAKVGSNEAGAAGDEEEGRRGKLKVFITHNG